MSITVFGEGRRSGADLCCTTTARDAYARAMGACIDAKACVASLADQ